MADEAQTPEDDAQQPQQSPPSGGRGRGLIVAFVGIVVLLETGMFFFLVPSAEEVSALAEAKLIESVQEGEAAAAEQTLDENKVEEFDLGLFGVTFSPIDTERTYRVEISLYGLIRKKNDDKMSAEYEEKEGRLRHAVQMKVRNSALEELSENNLGLLERRILTTCNHLLEDDLLLGIGFKSYQLLEQ